MLNMHQNCFWQAPWPYWESFQRYPKPPSRLRDCTLRTPYQKILATPLQQATQHDIVPRRDGTLNAQQQIQPAVPLLSPSANCASDT